MINLLVVAVSIHTFMGGFTHWKKSQFYNDCSPNLITVNPSES
jgi:hypothetical protein